MRLSRKEVIELIESIEAGGGDATELRAELNRLEPATRPQMATRNGAMQLEREELTTEERLSIEVGDLFQGGITTEVFNQLCHLDSQYSLQQLKDMCVKVGLSPNGHKKKLAAKLMARGYFMEEREPSWSPEKVDMTKQHEWEGEPGQVRIPDEYVKGLRYEIIVFTRKERGGNDLTFRCCDYEKNPDDRWGFRGVVIDTSKKDSQGNVDVVRISYHPEIFLVDTSFMVVPAPELEE